MEDRRRSTRITGARNDAASLPTTQGVQVLDISVVGVLLHVGRRIDAGTRGCLRLNLGGTAFVADVEVRRVAPVGEGRPELGYRVGATFVGITPEHRQLIEQFGSQ